MSTEEGAMRLGIVFVALAFMTCDAQANRPVPRTAPTATPAPAASTAPPGERRLDPATVSPAEGSVLSRARAALAAEEPGRARRLTEQALEGASSVRAARLRWVAAEAALREDDRDAALALLAPVAAQPGGLGPWAALWRAELLSRADRPAEAAEAAAPLAERDWGGRGRARTVHATALAAAGRTAEAVPALRELVEAAPDHVGAATAGMPLAAILAESDEPSEREEALALYRRVATRAPLSSVGRRAVERAEEVLATLPPDRRRALREIPVEDAFVRARALLSAVHHEEAERAFAELAKRLERDPARRCRAELGEGRALLRQRERREAAAHMKRLASRCKDTDVRAWAHYYAGRAHAKRGENEEAIAQYEKLEQVAPGHRLADDGLYRAALAAAEEDDDEGLVSRLEALPERYPDGDMRGRARFRLAWRAREAGEHEAALSHLEALLREGPQENREALVGRAAYWRAHVLADLGRSEEAVAAWAELARDWPLTYYAQQALARLDEQAPAKAEAIRADMRPEGRTEPLTFPWRAEMDEPGFERALELLRVGAIDRAMAELEHLGATGEGADDDLLWLVAALLDRAGAHPKSSLLVRRRLHSFRRTLPVGRARQMWRLAYPKAFAPLIERVAAGEQVPSTFVRAVAREESAFDPKAVSVAHAYGLIQLIGPTARRFAKELDLPADREALHTPEINLRIGTRFIAYLWEHFEDNPALVPAAYNAGENAVKRWLRERPDEPLDVWVENIPYDETRRYTRRVLQTYGVYNWLDDGRLPPLREKVPAP